MLKLESYLAPWLFSYLNKYIKNLKSEDLKLSLWGGEVKLSNLDLKLDVLQKEINLPFELINGHIHELTISIPYYSLRSEPIVICVNLLEFTFKLPGNDDIDNVKQDDYQESKEKKAYQGQSDGQNFNQNMDGTFTSSWWSNFVTNNVKYQFTNVVLKYIEKAEFSGNDPITFTLHIKRGEYGSHLLFDLIHPTPQKSANLREQLTQGKTKYTGGSLPNVSTDRASSHYKFNFPFDIPLPFNIGTVGGMSSKILLIHDITLCLDNVHSNDVSGGEEEVKQEPWIHQDPILKKCDLTMFFCPDNTSSSDNAMLKIYLGISELIITLTDAQLPLASRLLQLCLTFVRGDLSNTPQLKNQEFEQSLVNIIEPEVALDQPSKNDIVEISKSSTMMNWAYSLFIEDSELETISPNSDSNTSTTNFPNKPHKIPKLSIKLCFTMNSLNFRIKTLRIKSRPTSKGVQYKINPLPCLQALASQIALDMVYRAADLVHANFAIQDLVINSQPETCPCFGTIVAPLSPFEPHHNALSCTPIFEKLDNCSNHDPNEKDESSNFSLKHLNKLFDIEKSSSILIDDIYKTVCENMGFTNFKDGKPTDLYDGKEAGDLIKISYIFVAVPATQLLPCNSRPGEVNDRGALTVVVNPFSLNLTGYFYYHILTYINILKHSTFNPYVKNAYNSLEATTVLRSVNIQITGSQVTLYPSFDLQYSSSETSARVVILIDEIIVEVHTANPFTLGSLDNLPTIFKSDHHLGSFDNELLANNDHLRNSTFRCIVTRIKGIAFTFYPFKISCKIGRSSLSPDITFKSHTILTTDGQLKNYYSEVIVKILSLSVPSTVIPVLFVITISWIPWNRSYIFGEGLHILAFNKPLNGSYGHNIDVLPDAENVSLRLKIGPIKSKHLISFQNGEDCNQNEEIMLECLKLEVNLIKDVSVVSSVKKNYPLLSITHDKNTGTENGLKIHYVGDLAPSVNIECETVGLIWDIYAMNYLLSMLVNYANTLCTHYQNTIENFHNDTKDSFNESLSISEFSRRSSSYDYYYTKKSLKITNLEPMEPLIDPIFGLSTVSNNSNSAQEIALFSCMDFQIRINAFVSSTSFRPISFINQDELCSFAMNNLTISKVSDKNSGRINLAATLSLSYKEDCILKRLPFKCTVSEKEIADNFQMKKEDEFLTHEDYEQFITDKLASVTIILQPDVINLKVNITLIEAIFNLTSSYTLFIRNYHLLKTLVFYLSRGVFNQNVNEMPTIIDDDYVDDQLPQRIYKIECLIPQVLLNFSIKDQSDFIVDINSLTLHTLLFDSTIFAILNVVDSKIIYKHMQKYAEYFSQSCFEKPIPSFRLIKCTFLRQRCHVNDNEFVNTFNLHINPVYVTRYVFHLPSILNHMALFFKIFEEIATIDDSAYAELCALHSNNLPTYKKRSNKISNHNGFPTASCFNSFATVQINMPQFDILVMYGDMDYYGMILSIKNFIVSTNYNLPNISKEASHLSISHSGKSFVFEFEQLHIKAIDKSYQPVHSHDLTPQQTEYIVLDCSTALPDQILNNKKNFLVDQRSSMFKLKITYTLISDNPVDISEQVNPIHCTMACIVKFDYGSDDLKINDGQDMQPPISIDIGSHRVRLLFDLFHSFDTLTKAYQKLTTAISYDGSQTNEDDESYVTEFDNQDECESFLNQNYDKQTLMRLKINKLEYTCNINLPTIRFNVVNFGTIKSNQQNDIDMPNPPKLTITLQHLSFELCQTYINKSALDHPLFYTLNCELDKINNYQLNEILLYHYKSTNLNSFARVSSKVKILIGHLKIFYETKKEGINIWTIINTLETDLLTQKEFCIIKGYFDYGKNNENNKEAQKHLSIYVIALLSINLPSNCLDFMIDELQGFKLSFKDLNIESNKSDDALFNSKLLTTLLSWNFYLYVPKIQTFYFTNSFNLDPDYKVFIKICINRLIYESKSLRSVSMFNKLKQLSLKASSLYMSIAIIVSNNAVKGHSWKRFFTVADIDLKSCLKFLSDGANLSHNYSYQPSDVCRESLFENDQNSQYTTAKICLVENLMNFIVGGIDINFGQEHFIAFTHLKVILANAIEKAGKITDGKEKMISRNPLTNSMRFCKRYVFKDDLRSADGGFTYIYSKSNSLPNDLEIQFCTNENEREVKSSMCWKYPEPRSIESLIFNPLPFTGDNLQNSTSQSIPCRLEYMEEDRQFIDSLEEVNGSREFSFKTMLEFHLVEGSVLNLPVNLHYNNSPIQARSWKITLIHSLNNEEDDLASNNNSAFKKPCSTVFCSPLTLAGSVIVDSCFILPNSINNTFIMRMSFDLKPTVITFKVVNHTITLLEMIQRKANGCISDNFIKDLSILAEIPAVNFSMCLSFKAVTFVQCEPLLSRLYLSKWVGKVNDCVSYVYEIGSLFKLPFVRCDSISIGCETKTSDNSENILVKAAISMLSKHQDQASLHLCISPEMYYSINQLHSIWKECFDTSANGVTEKDLLSYLPCSLILNNQSNMSLWVALSDTSTTSYNMNVKEIKPLSSLLYDWSFMSWKLYESEEFSIALSWDLKRWENFNIDKSKSNIQHFFKNQFYFRSQNITNYLTLIELQPQNAPYLDPAGVTVICPCHSCISTNLDLKNDLDRLLWLNQFNIKINGTSVVEKRDYPTHHSQSCDKELHTRYIISFTADNENIGDSQNKKLEYIVLNLIMLRNSTDRTKPNCSRDSYHVFFILSPPLILDPTFLHQWLTPYCFLAPDGQLVFEIDLKLKNTEKCIDYNETTFFILCYIKDKTCDFKENLFGIYSINPLCIYTQETILLLSVSQQKSLVLSTEITLTSSQCEEVLFGDKFSGKHRCIIDLIEQDLPIFVNELQSWSFSNQDWQFCASFWRPHELFNIRDLLNYPLIHGNFSKEPKNYAEILIRSQMFSLNLVKGINIPLLTLCPDIMVLNDTEHDLHLLFESGPSLYLSNHRSLNLSYQQLAINEKVGFKIGIDSSGEIKFSELLFIDLSYLRNASYKNTSPYRRADQTCLNPNGFSWFEIRLNDTLVYRLSIISTIQSDDSTGLIQGFQLISIKPRYKFRSIELLYDLKCAAHCLNFADNQTETANTHVLNVCLLKNADHFKFVTLPKSLEFQFRQLGHVTCDRDEANNSLIIYIQRDLPPPLDQTQKYDDTYRWVGVEVPSLSFFSYNQKPKNIRKRFSFCYPLKPFLNEQPYTNSSENSYFCLSSTDIFHETNPSPNESYLNLYSYATSDFGITTDPNPPIIFRNCNKYSLLIFMSQKSDVTPYTEEVEFLEPNFLNVFVAHDKAQQLLKIPPNSLLGCEFLETSQRFNDFESNPKIHNLWFGYIPLDDDLTREESAKLKSITWALAPYNISTPDAKDLAKTKNVGQIPIMINQTLTWINVIEHLHPFPTRVLSIYFGLVDTIPCLDNLNSTPHHNYEIRIELPLLEITLARRLICNLYKDQTDLFENIGFQKIKSNDLKEITDKGYIRKYHMLQEIINITSKTLNLTLTFNKHSFIAASPLTHCIQEASIGINQLIIYNCLFGRQFYTQLESNYLKDHTSSTFYEFPIILYFGQPTQKWTKTSALKFGLKWQYQKSSFDAQPSNSRASRQIAIDYCLMIAEETESQALKIEKSNAVPIFIVSLEDTLFLPLLTTYFIKYSSSKIGKKRVSKERKNAPVPSNHFNNSILINKIFISPIKIKLAMQFYVSKIFISSSNTPIFLPLYHKYNIYGTYNSFLKFLVNYYFKNILKDSGWIIGSLDMIGSPAYLLSSFKEGLNDIFSYSNDSQSISSSTFYDTICLLTRNISYGGANMTKSLSASVLLCFGNLFMSLSRNMEHVSMDQDHVYIQKLARMRYNSRSENFQETQLSTLKLAKGDIAQGLTALGLSILGAVGGIIDLPIREIQKYHDQVQNNFQYDKKGISTISHVSTYARLTSFGLFKGMLGVIVKPVCGISELLASSAKGILTLVGYNVSNMPSRDAFDLVIDYGEGLNLKVYNAWVQSSSEKLKADTYILGESIILNTNFVDPKILATAKVAFIIVKCPTFVFNDISIFKNDESHCGLLYIFKILEPGYEPIMTMPLNELLCKKSIAGAYKKLTVYSYDENELKRLQILNNHEKSLEILPLLKIISAQNYLKDLIVVEDMINTSDTDLLLRHLNINEKFSCILNCNDTDYTFLNILEDIIMDCYMGT